MAIVGATIQVAFWSIIVPVGILVAMQLFSTAFFTIGTMLFWVIDLLQTVFRKLAGLDTMYIDGEAYTGDILTSILKSQVVVDTLISVTIFAVALVIIATIVQMIRTEYTTEGSKNSKESIIGKGLKSLVMFVLIPVVCFFGIRTSNYLLKAVDAATSGGGSSSIAGSVFVASATDACRLSDESKETKFYLPNLSITSILTALIPTSLSRAQLGGVSGGYYVRHFENVLKTSATSEERARADLTKQIDSLISMPVSEAKLSSGDYGGGVAITGHIYYGNVGAVGYFYDFGSINMIVLYVGCYLVLTSLFNAALGMIVRLYKCTVLFIIAPAAIGLQPLDDGNAYKKWRGQFISNVLSAYGVIVGLNLFFVVSGIVSKIELWDSIILYPLNRFMQAFFVVAGATQLKAIAKMIGDLIGAADAMSEGEGVAKGVSGVVGGMGKMAGGVAKVGAGIASKVRENMATKEAKTARKGLMELEGNTMMTNEEKEAKRIELTTSLQKAEVARQVNRNRAKAVFNGTKIGGMLGDLTGGVKSVMDGSWAKGTDDASLAKLKKKGVDPDGKLGGKYVEDLNEKDENMGKHALLHMATGGTKLAGAAIMGSAGFLKGIFQGHPIKSAKQGVEFASSLNEMIDPSLFDTAFGDADEGTVAASNQSAIAYSTARTNAIATVKEQADVQRAIDKERKHDTMVSNESAPSALYSGQKSFADNALRDVETKLGTSGGINESDASDIRTALDTLKSGSFDGSVTKALAESILSQIGSSGAIAENAANIARQLFSGADKGYLAKEFASSTSETRGTMKDIHASKVKTDELETEARDTINKPDTNADGAESAVKKFTDEMTKFQQSNNENLQEAVRNALAAGVTIRGTDGKPLEVNSKAFVDAIKDLKRATEEASSKKDEKEMAKTLKDMLKELKKKK